MTTLAARAVRRPGRHVARVVLSLALGAAAYLAWRFQPVPWHVESSAAHLCRGEYARARRPVDTLTVDGYVAPVTRREWRRVPSCGELRAAGKI